MITVFDEDKGYVGRGYYEGGNSAVNKVWRRGLLLLYHLLREERFHTVDSVDTLCGFNLIRVQDERYVITV